MDLNKIEDIKEVYSYWRGLIKTMPDSYDLSYKILGVSVNDNFDTWSQEDNRFDKITELASFLETSPGDKKRWSEIRKLLK